MLRRSNLSLASKRTAKESFEYCKSHYNSGIGRVHELMMEKGEGSYIIDTEGKKYLDFIAGIGVCNFGHCHPELVSVAQNQLTKLWHGQINTGFHQPMEEFIERMGRLMPKGLNNVLCVTTGSEAVESAIKLSFGARPGRHCLAALQGGYHGRTAGAASLTTSKYSYARGIKPLLPGVVILPVPYHKQMKVPLSVPVDQLTEIALAQAEDVFTQQVYGEDVSMLIIEPILGEGGYVPLPYSYMKGLRDLTKKYGIMLVSDEIQCGFGRTGTVMFTEQYPEDCLPDAITFAKGVANGLPLAGLVTTDEIGQKNTPLTQGGTYAGNCVAVAVANKVCQILEDNKEKKSNSLKILENVKERSEQLISGMLAMIEKNRLPISEVRGRGLMLGLEFEGPAGISVTFKNECFKRGLSLPTTGKFEAVRLIPPLTLSESEANDALKIMEEAGVATIAAHGGESAKSPVVKGFLEDGFLPGSKVPLRWTTKY